MSLNHSVQTLEPGSEITLFELDGTCLLYTSDAADE